MALKVNRAHHGRERFFTSFSFSRFTDCLISLLRTTPVAFIQRLQPEAAPNSYTGADPVKLQRQIAKHGTSIAGMPPLLAYEGSDGALELYDGVTRATRVAKLLPGTTARVEILGKLKRPKAQNRRVGDAL